MSTSTTSLTLQEAWYALAAAHAWSTAPRWREPYEPFLLAFASHLATSLRRQCIAHRPTRRDPGFGNIVGRRGQDVARSAGRAPGLASRTSGKGVEGNRSDHIVDRKAIELYTEPFP